jgi:hypothetical protein
VPFQNVNDHLCGGHHERLIPPASTLFHRFTHFALLCRSLAETIETAWVRWDVTVSPAKSALFLLLADKDGQRKASPLNLY